MRHLAGGVHPGIGAPGHRQPDVEPQNAGQRILQDPGDGTPAGLTGPTGEIRAVVRDLQSQTNEPAISDGGLVGAAVR
jgi:hypothetical protein